MDKYTKHHTIQKNNNILINCLINLSKKLFQFWGSFFSEKYTKSIVAQEELKYTLKLLLHNYVIKLLLYYIH